MINILLSVIIVVLVAIWFKLEKKEVKKAKPVDKLEPKHSEDKELLSSKSEEKKPIQRHEDWFKLCEDVVLDKEQNRTPNNFIFKKFGTTKGTFFAKATEDQKRRFVKIKYVRPIKEETNPVWIERIDKALNMKEEKLMSDNKMFMHAGFNR